MSGATVIEVGRGDAVIVLAERALSPETQRAMQAAIDSLLDKQGRFSLFGDMANATVIVFRNARLDVMQEGVR